MVNEVTYADVAATLPRDIVESIEVSLPCAFSANRIHMWDIVVDPQVDDLQGTVTLTKLWRCVYCGASTHTHPRMPVVSSPAWNILTADQLLRTWT